ncbi:hypothetical protein OSH08_11675 [Kaistia geumhonensis]|uniref:Alkaline proteinase inhibitor/ Outer membrane lipoprotein Omp19 domain-containing protein n=1 Tax=Kaistia geumhonensis TaxID=410839 RepID=A0ABU0M2C6_9HYPH|nr:hypothetical protein [Kaistia geumhonensis]MCX5479667.1 hypothetical protein [Kaistia geumhonensis]MDQ0515109.1 hypothetical protein [Kaistia geumhonensis]
MTSLRRIVLVALPAAALIAGAGLAAAEPISGQWTGSFKQSNEPGSYAVAIDFAREPAAIDYADQSCGGTLEKVGEKGATSFYVETITRGGVDPATGHGCLNGNVVLMRTGDTLLWGWIGEHKGQAFSATAILARKP